MSFVKERKKQLGVILLADALDMQQARPVGAFYYVSTVVKGLIEEGVAVTTLHFRKNQFLNDR